MFGDNEQHRICSACVAKDGKRKAPAADTGPVEGDNLNARRSRMGGVRSFSLLERGLVRGRIWTPSLRC
ncbi:unnamed protein product [Ectocarpus sp. CCAP 1310/34]|nr:unnamed protein product [Ectocarpus sp. CCAP 1310/34]